MVLIALPNQKPYSRFGIAAGRSLGKAVKRNRAKRILRSALQSVVKEISPGWDIVLLARRPMIGLNTGEAQTTLIYLLRSANLLPQSDIEASNAF